MGAAPSAPTTVPFGSHSTLLNSTLFCVGGNGLNNTLPIDISVTAPLSANGVFNFTDIQVHVPLTRSALSLYINTTVVFSTNASPPEFQLSSFGLKDQDTPPDIYVPSSGVAQAGPFTMVNDFARLKLKYIYFYGYNTAAVYTSNCTLEPHDLISVAKGQLSSASTAPANGVRASFPITNAGTKSEIANLPGSCQSSDAKFSLQATIPQNLPARKAFNISNADYFFTTQSSTATAYVVQYGVQAEEQGVGIPVSLSNSQFSTFDLARNFVATDPDAATPLNGGTYTDGKPRSLTIQAPTRGSISYSLNAGASGIFSVAYRAIAGTLRTNIGQSTFTCYNSTQNALLTAPIV